MANRIQSSDKFILVSNGQKLPNAEHTTGDINPLYRVQSINLNLSTPKFDINQFGQLPRVGTLVIEPPVSSLSFDYFLHNGRNEDFLGFSFSDDFSVSILSGVMDTTDSNSKRFGVQSGVNFFVLYTPAGRDAVGYVGSDTDARTIAVGNCYPVSYDIDLSVGSIPSASFSYEGMITNSVQNTSGILPSVNLENGALSTNTFQLPDVTTGDDVGVVALRPNDITLSFPASATNITDFSSTISVQSVAISIPLSRTTLQGLGSTYGYAKEIDTPIEATISVSMIARDIKSGNLNDEILNNPSHTFDINLKSPTGADVLAYRIKKARLESENFSNSIGDNETVDLEFSVQISSPENSEVGIYQSGSFA